MSHDENNLRHYSDNRHQQKNKFEDGNFCEYVYISIVGRPFTKLLPFVAVVNIYTLIFCMLLKCTGYLS